MVIMNFLVFCVVIVSSTKWLEYRFNRDYGDYFFDYSLNGHYGINGDSSTSSNVLSTDRGIYLQHTTSSVDIKASGSFPSPFTFSVWIMSKDTTLSIFYYKDSSSNIIFARGGGEDRIRLYLNSAVNYADPNDFYASKWYLLSLVYSSSSFTAYSNLKHSITVSKSFTPASSYTIGLGYTSGYHALDCIIWNFQIHSGVVDFSSLITTTGSSNCLQGQGSCSSCSVAFNDPDLETGCLTTSFDEDSNAFGTSCSSGGCTKTVLLSCDLSSSFCTYDQETNTCYSKSISSDMLLKPSTVISCQCQSPYVSRNDKCCDGICSNCDYLGVCSGCYSNNAKYSGGQCTCDQGYYSAGDFSESNNCVACEEGCDICSSTLCSKCSDSNAIANGKYCVCKDKYFGNPTSCQDCRASCKKCTALDFCTECENINAEVKNNMCTCKVGYFGNGLTCDQCHSSCKSCTSSTSCSECKVQNSHTNGGSCLCDKGFYGDASVQCLSCDITCADCSEAQICIKCKDALGLKNGGVCSCPDGYFQDSSYLCIMCDTGCSKCTDLTHCSECYDSNSKVDGGKCKCDDGFYGNLDIENCISCQLGCAKCTAAECQECLDANSLPDSIQCVCENGFFKTENDYQCIPCEPECLRCDQFKCLECISASSFIEGPNCLPCEVGCRKCEQLKCLECVSWNTFVEGNRCICESGFWLDGEMSDSDSCKPCHADCQSCISEKSCLTCKSSAAKPHNIEGCECKAGYWNNSMLDQENSCKSCNPDCLSCNNSQFCLSCKAENSLPSEKNGCQCIPGYFNHSTLTESDSCQPCHDDCETCSSFDRCSTCKKGKGELNSLKHCVVLCWKNSLNTSNCLQCPDLCTQCDEDLRCTQCIKNSEKVHERCICGKGFKKVNNSCVESFFYGKLTVSENNKLRIRFSEDLEKNLSAVNLLLEYQGKRLKFSLLQKRYNSVLIVPEVNVEKDQQKRIFIHIKSKIYSVSGSLLFNQTFEGYLNYLPAEVVLMGISITQGAKGAVLISVATSLASDPSSLWSLLNTIQLIIFMPLNSVDYPEKLKAMSNSLMSYNSIPNIFSLFIGHNSTSLPYNKAFEFGINTSVLLINIGQISVILIFTSICLFILILIEKYCFRSPKLTILKQKYQFGFFIRFWIQSYLELGIFSIVQLKSEIKSFVAGFFNMCFALILTVTSKKILLVASPFMFFYFLKYSERKTFERNFRLKFGSLFEEFKEEKKWVRTFYYPIILLRRLEYVFVQIFLVEFPWLAVWTNIGFSLIILVFLIYARPFKNPAAMASALIGEFCVNSVFICSSFFLLIKDQDQIKRIENACIYIIVTSTGTQIIIGLYTFAVEVRKLYLKLEKSRALQFASSANDRIIRQNQRETFNGQISSGC